MTKQLPDAVTNELRERLRRFLASRPDLSPVDLAHHTTLAESTVRNFANGHCPGGHEVYREVRRVLEMAEAGQILQPGDGRAVVVAVERAARVRRVPQSRHFYTTETVRKIGEVLDYCAEHSAIGVITADFGVGKTEAVQAWRRGNGRAESIVFEFDEFSSSNKVDFVHELAALLDLDVPKGSQAGGKVFRLVCDRLCEQPCLLIFDQCEVVRARVFQIIRQIWDRTRHAGVGIVLLAAPILMQRMLGSRMADLGALTSRVGIWAPLAGLTKAEMAAIVKQEGIADVDEAAFEVWYRAVGGSMRRLMAAIDLLRAKHQGKPVTSKTISGLAGHLWGMRVEAA